MGRRETIKALEVIGLSEVYLKTKIEKETDKAGLLKKLFESFKDCSKCSLYRSRRQVVFGDGNPYSPVAFVGEAPGEEEDVQGKPFVGRAGKYLNRKLEEILNMKREQVYITNVCKCRPPANRKPTSVEIATCLPYLRQELQIIKPKVICCLGSTAAEGILGKKLSITRLRGQLFSYPYDQKIKVFFTYHPAYILRNPRSEAEFVEDLEKLKELIGQS